MKVFPEYLISAIHYVFREGGYGMITAAVVLVAFASVLFQDDFSDGNADGWFQVGSPDYTVENSQYHFSGGGAVNDATSYRGEQGETMSTPDYSLTSDVRIDVGTFGGCMVRYRQDGPYNLLLVLGLPQQSLNLYRWHWDSIELLDSYSMTVLEDTYYTIRFQCSENTFSGRAWETGMAEPDDWQVWSQDTLSTPGAAALFCAGVFKSSGSAQDECSATFNGNSFCAGVFKGGSRVYMSCWFDNVIVEDPEPWALIPFTWAEIKTVF